MLRGSFHAVPTDARCKMRSPTKINLCLILDGHLLRCAWCVWLWLWRHGIHYRSPQWLRTGIHDLISIFWQLLRSVYLFSALNGKILFSTFYTISQLFRHGFCHPCRLSLFLVVVQCIECRKDRRQSQVISVTLCTHDTLTRSRFVGRYDTKWYKKLTNFN